MYRHIEIVEVEVTSKSAIALLIAVGFERRFKEPDASDATLLVNTLDLLTGKALWGLHNDQRFSSPTSNINTGIRIMGAADKAREQGAAHVTLAEADYELLKAAASEPNIHPGITPPTAEVARLLMPIMEAVRTAEKSD